MSYTLNRHAESSIAGLVLTMPNNISKLDIGLASDNVARLHFSSQNERHVVGHTCQMDDSSGSASSKLVRTRRRADLEQLAIDKLYGKIFSTLLMI
jgi:hypothetical protein